MITGAHIGDENAAHLDGMEDRVYLAFFGGKNAKAADIGQAEEVSIVMNGTVNSDLDVGGIICKRGGLYADQGNQYNQALLHIVHPSLFKLCSKMITWHS